MVKIVSIIFLIICNISYGFSDGASGSRIIDRLDRMERDFIALQRQFYRGKAPETGEIVGDRGMNVANVEAKISSLEEKIRQLNGHIEQLQHELNKLQQAAKNNIIDNHPVAQPENVKKSEPKKLENNNKAAVKTSPTVPPKVEIINEPKVIETIKETKKENEEENSDNPTLEEELEEQGIKETDSAKSLYDKSFAYLRASKFDNAEKGFSDFITKYKGHELVGNAYYWLGETFFVRKNYKQAGANFIKSYKESPNGNKAYESLLKLATSFSHLDKKKEACSVINKLDGFNSKLANNLKQRVREESSRIGCK